MFNLDSMLDPVAILERKVIDSPRAIAILLIENQEEIETLRSLVRFYARKAGVTDPDVLERPF